MKKCRLCKKEKPNDTKLRQDGGLCNACRTKIRRYRVKAACIRFLGGRCVHCGWSGKQAGFEFHHTNPEEKEFQIGRYINRKWEVIKEELKKCILLCSTCHCIEHSTKETEEFLEEVRNYNGREMV